MLFHDVKKLPWPKRSKLIRQNRWQWICRRCIGWISLGFHRRCFDISSKKQFPECSTDIWLIFMKKAYKIFLHLHEAVFEKLQKVLYFDQQCVFFTVSLAITVSSAITGRSIPSSIIEVLTNKLKSFESSHGLTSRSGITKSLPWVLKWLEASVSFSRKCTYPGEQYPPIRGGN